MDAFRAGDLDTLSAFSALLAAHAHAFASGYAQTAVIAARTEPSWNLGCFPGFSTAASGSSLPAASGFRCCSIGFPPYKY